MTSSAPSTEGGNTSNDLYNDPAVEGMFQKNSGNENVFSPGVHETFTMPGNPPGVMNAPATPVSLLRQFLRWLVLCPAHAIPCIGFALIAPGYGNKVEVMVGMGAAILTFAMALTALTTFHPPMADPASPLARAFSTGLKTRGYISVAGIVCMPMAGPFLIIDMYCGLLATRWVELAGLGYTRSWYLSHMAGDAGILKSYATSMVTGCLVLFSVVILSFFALIIQQSRMARRAFRHPDPRRMNGI